MEPSLVFMEVTTLTQSCVSPETAKFIIFFQIGTDLSQYYHFVISVAYKLYLNIKTKKNLSLSLNTF